MTSPKPSIQRERVQLHASVEDYERAQNDIDRRAAVAAINANVLRRTGFAVSGPDVNELAKLTVALVKGRATVGLLGIDHQISTICTEKKLHSVAQGLPEPVKARLDKLV